MHSSQSPGGLASAAGEPGDRSDRTVAQRFVNEIPEVEDEVDLLLRTRGGLIVDQGAPRMVVATLVRLAGGEGDPHGTIRRGQRRCPRATGRIRHVGARAEPVVVACVGRESFDQHPHREIRGGGRDEPLLGDDPREVLRRGDLEDERDRVDAPRGGLHAGPQHDGGRGGVAGRKSLGKVMPTGRRGGVEPGWEGRGAGEGETTGPPQEGGNKVAAVHGGPQKRRVRLSPKRRGSPPTKVGPS